MTSLDLDHVGIAVTNLDDAASKFRRLGFQLTPRGYHTLPPPEPSAGRPRVGTGNHCAMMRQGYLELIGITDPAYQGRLRADIARYEGIHIVAFGTADIAALARKILGGGIEVSRPRMLERPIEEGGSTHLARFEILDFPGELLPEGHFFAIHHATPALLWKKELLTHPNGAASLKALTIAVVDPANFARRLGSVLSAKPIAGDEPLFALNSTSLRIVDAGWVAANFPGQTPSPPYIAGVGLGVTDLNQTAGVLGQNGVAFRRERGALMVSPSEGCGSYIEFQPETVRG